MVRMSPSEDKQEKYLSGQLPQPRNDPQDSSVHNGSTKRMALLDHTKKLYVIQSCCQKVSFWILPVIQIIPELHSMYPQEINCAVCNEFSLHTLVKTN
jgi:hypothetical protein